MPLLQRLAGLDNPPPEVSKVINLLSIEIDTINTVVRTGQNLDKAHENLEEYLHLFRSLVAQDPNLDIARAGLQLIKNKFSVTFGLLEARGEFPEKLVFPLFELIWFASDSLSSFSNLLVNHQKDPNYTVIIDLAVEFLKRHGIPITGLINDHYDESIKLLTPIEETYILDYIANKSEEPIYYRIKKLFSAYPSRHHALAMFLCEIVIDTKVTDTKTLMVLRDWIRFTTLGTLEARFTKLISDLETGKTPQRAFEPHQIEYELLDLVRKHTDNIFSQMATTRSMAIKGALLNFDKMVNFNNLVSEIELFMRWNESIKAKVKNLQMVLHIEQAVNARATMTTSVNKMEP